MAEGAKCVQIRSELCAELKPSISGWVLVLPILLVCPPSKSQNATLAATMLEVMLMQHLKLSLNI